MCLLDRIHVEGTVVQWNGKKAGTRNTDDVKCTSISLTDANGNILSTLRREKNVAVNEHIMCFLMTAVVS